MLDELTRLLEIQHKDTEILSLREKETRLSVDLSMKEEKLEEKKRELVEKKEELKGMKVARKSQDIELDSRLAKIQKMEVQLFQLRTNEEYQALQKEIESLKDECTALEDDILNLMERMEEAQHEIAEVGTSVAEAEAEVRRAGESLRRERGDIAAEIDRLQGGKKIIASSVDGFLMERYEKLMSHYGNRAIVPLANNICQGCYTNLPRHTVDELRVSSKPFFCQNCSRILYLADNPNE